LLERALTERLPSELNSKGKNEYVMRLYQQIPPEEQERVAGRIAFSFGQKPEFTDVRDVANRFPNGSTQLRAIESTLEGACSRSPKDAESAFRKFTTDLQPGPEYNAALNGMAL